jgi:hypothetical protein
MLGEPSALPIIRGYSPWLAVFGVGGAPASCAGDGGPRAFDAAILGDALVIAAPTRAASGEANE